MVNPPKGGRRGTGALSGAGVGDEFHHYRENAAADVDDEEDDEEDDDEEEEEEDDDDEDDEEGEEDDDVDEDDDDDEQQHMNVEGGEEEEELGPEALSQLLGALASGVRAVQGIPIGEEYEYESSFPEFVTKLSQAKSSFTRTLKDALSLTCGVFDTTTALIEDTSTITTATMIAAATKSTTGGGSGGQSTGGANDRKSNRNKKSTTSTKHDEQSSNNDNSSSIDDIEDLLLHHTASTLDDPVLWEKCADACDVLMDQVEASMQILSQKQQQQHNPDENQQQESTALLSNLQKFSNQARHRSQKGFGHLLESLVDMEKPQITYHFRVQNSRTEPFVPPIQYNRNSSKKPHGITPLALEARLSGHGLDTRFPSGLRSSGGGTNNNNNSSSSATKTKIYPSNLVAPTSHVPHMYQKEIESLTYTSLQLQATKPSTKAIAEVEQLDASWIDTPEDLQSLLNDLERNGVTEVALDLEAHSYRSFSGFVCLMQLSYRVAGSGGGGDGNSVNDPNRIRNYLIDTIALRDCLNRYLQPMLANPRIVKVMHGADSDIQWLQRDFGLYVVNLFDTGRAARALQSCSSASYAYLLQKYVNITADKSYQLSDWRQRPISQQMKHYAIQDTYYLLDIYERLKWDLVQQQGNRSSSTAPIKEVLDTSKQVCLIRYAVEPFDPDGYKTLLSSNSRRSVQKGAHKPVITEASDLQRNVLKALWDWRDSMARENDESIQYVCPNKALLRIALSVNEHSSMTLRSLQSLLNPLPSLVLQNAQQIIDIVKRQQRRQHQEKEMNNDEDDDEEDIRSSSAAQHPQQTKQTVGAPSSAFFKPAMSSSLSWNSKENMALRRSGGVMSPVLGTEALYKQAGWITPKPEKPSPSASVALPGQACDNTKDPMIVDINTTSADEDDDTAGSKPKRLLSVHSSNKNYTADSSGNTKHLQDEGTDSICADGMGTVKAAIRAVDSSQSPGYPSATDSDSRRAKQHAMRIRTSLQKETIAAVLGLVHPYIDVDDDEGAEDRERQTPTRGGSLGGNDSPNKSGDGATGEAKAYRDPDLMDEEDYPIPRSMREIYKISNRNRRNKKAGSPTPERGVTPTSEKEREELAQAEALLREKGLLSSSYFDDGSGVPGKRQRTKALSGRESEESVPSETFVSAASREEDLAVIKSVGWIQSGAGGVHGAAEGVNDPNKDTAAAAFGYDYSTVGAIGALGPTSSSATGMQQSHNPFFAGAALAGGPSAQSFTGKTEQQRSSKSSGSNRGGSSNRGRQNRRQERPEKKEGRTHAYRKR